MQNKVLDTIRQFNMLKAGERVLVGLSGGADSVSLSLCLQYLGYDVYAVHINHCLRGEESDRDEAFCRDFCKSRGIELSVFRVDVTQYCEKNKLSVELGARKLRYEIFSKVLKDFGATKLATAHSLSDCLETTLLNLARGCSVKGMCGIPPVRDNVIRPLINCTRDEIEQFLSDENQPYVTDSTNLVDDCSRNIIRLNVIPQLMRINNGLMKAYESNLENFRAASEYIDCKARDIISSVRLKDSCYDAASLLSVKQPVLGTAIGIIFTEYGIETSSDKINRIIELCKNGGKLSLARNVYAKCKGNVLSICSEEKKETQRLSTPLVFDKEISFLEKNVLVRKRINVCDSNVHKKFTKNVVDCDKIIGAAVIRNRRDGDKIKLQGRDVTSSVKTLFNAKVPRELRDNVVFLADELGVFFVEGFGCAQRVAPDEKSTDCAEILIAPCH